MALKCDLCNQTILLTDAVCWHCGKELNTTQTPASNETKESKSTLLAKSEPISITAVSIFTLITLITIILFIIVTNILASYPPG